MLGSGTVGNELSWQEGCSLLCLSDELRVILSGPEGDSRVGKVKIVLFLVFGKTISY